MATAEMHTSFSDGNSALAERRNLGSVLLLTGRSWGELIVCDQEKSVGIDCTISSGQQGDIGSKTFCFEEGCLPECSTVYLTDIN
jgi:hypothetical protein